MPASTRDEDVGSLSDPSEPVTEKRGPLAASDDDESPPVKRDQDDPAKDDNDKGHGLVLAPSVDGSVTARESLNNDDAASPQENEKRTALEDEDFPDGGWRAWGVVLGCWTISFATWGAINAFGTYQEYYSTHQLRNYSPSAISWLGSLQLGLTFGCAIFAGALFDAGYMRHILVAGVIIYLAGFFGLASATQYWQFLLAQGFANGLGCGILFLPASGCIGHWWRRRRAFAFGVQATGSSIGGVVFPAMLSRLFVRIGFAWAVRCAAFVTVALLAVAQLGLRTRLPPRPRAKLIAWEYFLDIGFVLLNVGSFLILWGLYVPYYYLPTYSLAHGVPPNISNYALSILNAGSLLGRVIPNYFADTTGPHVILVGHCLAAGILVFCWQRAASTSAGTIVFSILYGWASGVFVSTSPACLSQLLKRQSEIGVAFSLYYFVISFGVMTGNPIAGAIIAHQGGKYTGAVLFAGLSILVGTACLALNWYIIAKRKDTWRV